MAKTAQGAVTKWFEMAGYCVTAPKLQGIG